MLQWAVSADRALVSVHKTAQLNTFIDTKNCSASLKCHAIPLNPTTEIIVFPFFLLLSRFSKVFTWFFHSEQDSLHSEMKIQLLDSSCMLLGLQGCDVSF